MNIRSSSGPMVDPGRIVVPKLLESIRRPDQSGFTLIEITFAILI